MAGQIAENTALANDARAKAEAAQAQADAAFKSAAMANNRINGLDSYDTIKTVSILFPLNSSMIDATAKQMADSFFDRFSAQVSAPAPEPEAPEPEAREPETRQIYPAAPSEEVCGRYAVTCCLASSAGM